MATRQHCTDIFSHVMEKVLELKKDSTMFKAITTQGYDGMDDIITMDGQEIMGLSLTGDDNKKVPILTKDKKKLLHLVWWHDYMISQKVPQIISNEEWLDLMKEKFDKFRVEVVPTLARGDDPASKSATSSMSNDSIVTRQQVEAFQKGHKRDKDAYIAWNGENRGWVVGSESSVTGQVLQQPMG
jgi:hypothetical protein